MPTLISEEQAKRDALLLAWYEAKSQAEEVKPIIARELELRKELFALMYQQPTEGVNKLELNDGYVLKGTYKLDRKIDEAVLPAVMEELRREHGLNADTLIEWKPSLKTSVYRELTAEQIQVMDKALIIKPSTPTIEIVEPKKKG